MSDLQIALTVVGALVIGCVIAYNRIQENRFRRRARESFSGVHGDALLDPLSANREDRIEPLLTSAPAEAEGPVDAGNARPGRVEPSGVPAAAPESPRNMLPPPTTRHIWTPTSVASFTSAAMRSTVATSMP